MCQAFEGEQRYVITSEVSEIKEKYRKHKAGEEVLSDEALRELIAQYMVLTM